MLYVLAAVLGMFAMAYFIENMRRKREYARVLEGEWASLEDLMRDKELSAEESTLLSEIVRRYAPDDPYRAATLRQGFNLCVERAMQDAEAVSVAAAEKTGVVLRDIRVKLGLEYVPFGQRIQSTRELYLKQPVWVASGSSAEGKEWVRTTVSTVDEGHFYLAHEDATPMPVFSPGTTMRCRMWREEDARYEFSARLVRETSEPHTWMLAHTKELLRRQARAHFRIHFEQAVDVGIVNAPVDGNLSNVDERPVVTRLRGRVNSLSGGGYAVIVTQPVPRQVLLRIALEVDPGQEPLPTTARIVGTVEMPGGRYLLRAAFVCMSEEQREQITRLVFQRQQPGGLTDGRE